MLIHFASIYENLNTAFHKTICIVIFTSKVVYFNVCHYLFFTYGYFSS